MLTQGLHVADWIGRNCRHTIGRWAGDPVIFEDFQREFLWEAFETDESGRRVYHDALVGLPRKNAKSTMASGIALYLAGPDEEPGAQVILGAPSRENTREVFDQARGFVDSSPTLQRSFLAERYHIYFRDPLTGRKGTIRRSAADGKSQHGSNPHGLVVDEVHGLLTARQREAFTGWTTGSGARENPFRLYISTAGYDPDSLLWEMYSGALQLADVEERRPGLIVARDRDAGFLMYWFGAPSGCEINAESVRLANPASWIDPVERLAELASPRMSENEFRRVYLNQWTESRDAWFPLGMWRRLASGDAEWPAEGTSIWLGVDVGLTHDSTGIVASFRGESGRIVQRAHAWSVDPNSPAHTHVEGESFDLELAEDYILDLAKRYRIVTVAYDPRFFEGSAQRLRKRGVQCAPVYQSSAQMADVYQAYYRMVREGTIEHSGDPIYTAHVEGTAATLTDRGWRISKLHKRKRIDLVPSGALSAWQCDLGTRRPTMVGPSDEEIDEAGALRSIGFGAADYDEEDEW